MTLLLKNLKSVPAVCVSLYGIAVLGGAYIFEYGFGYLPCQLCLYQRVPWAVLIILGAVAYAMPKYEKPTLYLSAVVMLVGMGIAIFHSGVEYEFWDGLAGCTQTVPLATDTTSLLSSLNTETAPSCDIPAWTLFGISLSGYNAILSLDAMIFAWFLAKSK